jgi:adenosylhomocysteinase
MPLGDLFAEPAHLTERDELPLLRALIERYRRARPFDGATVVFGHLLVRNSMVVAEAAWRGGAELVFAEAHPSPAEAPVRADLARHGVRVLPAAEAARAGEWFLDVGAVLGRCRLPRGAAEVTRSGVHYYRQLGCPVISADDCRAKRIEGFFGTGDGFLRAWRQLLPQRPLEGLAVVIFGYGKIGRGVSHCLRRLPMRVTVVEADEAARRRAAQEGFTTAPSAGPDLQRALAQADVVISVTGVAGVIGRSVPAEWLRAGGATLVNLGAEDEFGPAFRDEEILGGRSLPLNFHLARPTLNRYVDPPLAAHLLALEALLRDPSAWSPGVHPLPAAMDEGLLRAWRAAWPDEDLTGIAEELGLPG